VRYRRFAFLIVCLTLTQWETSPPTVADTTTPARYTRSVTAICAHALLFEGRHAVGTRAGALAVAHDIRATNRRRLRRVAGLPVPSSEQRPVKRWLVLEQRLANVFATTYVRIYDVIAAATTPARRAREPARLNRLVHLPDRLEGTVLRLESRLHLPDCTGGIQSSPSRP